MAAVKFDGRSAVVQYVDRVLWEQIELEWAVKRGLAEVRDIILSEPDDVYRHALDEWQNDKSRLLLLEQLHKSVHDYREVMLTRAAGDNPATRTSPEWTNASAALGNALSEIVYECPRAADKA